MSDDEKLDRLESAVYWAENLMRAIVENDPDDIIADGGITVWHSIERDARHWLYVNALVLPARATKDTLPDIDDEVF